MRPSVLISSNIPGEVQEMLRKHLFDIAEVRFSTPSTRPEYFEELENAEVIIPLNEPIGEEILKHAPKLKAISRLGVGYDKIDVDACRRRRIYVTYTPGVVSCGVAELTMGLILSLSRRIPMADRYVRTQWAKRDKSLLPLREDLAGKTLGIIGLGRIGYQVARRARSFEMILIYYDRIRNIEREQELSMQYVGLEDLLKTSDFVSIHVSLNEATASLIGKKELALMKKTAYIINTSRGQVLDEEALFQALKESKIAGAALDVFAKEPLSFDSPLITMENIVLTPHMGTNTVETRKKMVLSVVDSVKGVLAGDIPLNIVPEQKGSF